MASMKPKKHQAIAPYTEDLAALDRDGFVALIVPGLVEHPVFDAAWNHPRILAAIEGPRCGCSAKRERCSS
jgi:hypothetical protein